MDDESAVITSAKPTEIIPANTLAAFKGPKTGVMAPLWQPGCPSPNPLGRPKGHKAFSKACREHTAQALAVMVAAMSSDDERLRVVAAEKLLERGWGRSPDRVDLDGEDGVADPAAAQARMLELVGQLMARKAAKDEAELPQYGPELPAGKEPGRMGALSTEWDAVSSAPEPRNGG